MEPDIVVLNVVSANRLYNRISESPTYCKSRRRWAAVLKSSGTTYYTVNDRKILSDCNHPVILPKGSCYSWICVEEGECLLVEFDTLVTCKTIFPFELSDTSFFVRNFYQIQKALSLDTADGRMEAFSRLYEILRQLFKSAEKEYTPKEKRNLIKPAENYILEHYFDLGITNDRLAALCGISTVYFRKCFEAVFGVSPIRYLHNYRTKKAKDILSSDFSSIEQVSESVGYSSVYHFSKMFKTYTGMSPSEYAKASRK